MKKLKRIVETFVEADLVAKTLFLFMIMMTCLALSSTAAIFLIVYSIVAGS